jgi:N-succinyl-L-ornithine transcarbamylase
MEHFISVNDVKDIDHLIGQALRFKHDPHAEHTLGAGKRLGLLFMNPSLRTRVSTQIAAANLGMECYVLNVGADNWPLEFIEGAVMDGSNVEHIKDAAPVMGTYFDIIGLRTFPSLRDRTIDYSEHVIQSLKKYCGTPVLSLETATVHPLQSLADLVTIKEMMPQGRRPKIAMTWAPHIKPIPQCVANSFSEWVCAWGGADFVIAQPEGFELDDAYICGAKVTHDQMEALEGADFVYMKNWSSYKDYGKVHGHAHDWMMTLDHLKHTNKAKLMHCLPVRRNVEVSDEVLDHPDCLTTHQASNRVWAAQAALAELLKSMA